ncbi:unnamed protein product [Sphagnum troendelagicum]|uniref:Uncharacterized protein n=1 Tax=Sphagnum troendelagicum TaxID=128251 RepID=A0ABP0TIY2_9BRYO
MANGSAADEEAALSDFEEDDLEAAPVVLPAASGTLNDGLKAAMAELEQERLKVRALEAAKAEGDANYTRMKAYAQETARRRDEALRAKEELSRALEEAMKEKEELSRQRDEFLKQRDEYSKARDTARAEIESTARLLIAGAEKVTSMVNGAKNFARSLPSSKYTGLAAIAYGFGKRMEEIVDEVVKQRDAAVKTRQETREQMEQRNYSIAIEVSELEASIMQLNEEVRKKNADINIWQKSAASKDERIVELENAFSEKIALAANQAYVLGQKADEAEGKNKILTEQLNSQTELFSELSRYVAKMKKGLLNLLPASSSSSSLSDSDTQAQQQEELASSSREASNSSTSSSSSAVDAKLQLPQQECLAGVKMLADLVATLVALWNRKQDEWSSERQEFVSRIERLVAQKQGSAELLTVALAEKQEGLESISNLRVEVSQQQSEISRLQALLKEAQEKQVAEELTSEQSDTASGAENVEIARLRVELTVAMQMRDEALSKHVLLTLPMVQQRTEKGGCFPMKVEGLTADIEAAEEEIVRWKQAATEEAAAGAAVLEEVDSCNAEIALLKQQITDMRRVVEEAKLEVRSKDEMSSAAIAARDAAERSLQMADERAMDLRDKVEELNKQLEEAFRVREFGGSTGIGGLFELCWPRWQSRGRSVSSSHNRGGGNSAAEMEQLLEPLV